jgi:hypothetical protein
LDRLFKKGGELKMDFNTAMRIGSEDGFAPATSSFDDLVQTTRIADMATSETPPLLDDAQPKPQESIVLVKMIADAAEALVGRMQTLDPENAATIATQLAGLVTTLEQLRADPSLGRTLSGAIGNLMRFITAALGRGDGGLEPFQGAELSDLAGKIGASLNALGTSAQLSPLQAAAQAATKAKLANTLGAGLGSLAASLPPATPNSITPAVTSAVDSLVSAAAAAVGRVEPETTPGLTEISLPDGAKNDSIAKKLLTILKSLNGTINNLDRQRDRGDFPVPMDAGFGSIGNVVSEVALSGGTGQVTGFDRANSLNLPDGGDNGSEFPRPPGWEPPSFPVSNYTVGSINPDSRFVPLVFFNQVLERDRTLPLLGRPDVNPNSLHSGVSRLFIDTRNTGLDVSISVEERLVDQENILGIGPLALYGSYKTTDTIPASRQGEVFTFGSLGQFTTRNVDATSLGLSQFMTNANQPRDTLSVEMYERVSGARNRASELVFSSRGTFNEDGNARNNIWLDLVNGSNAGIIDTMFGMKPEMVMNFLTGMDIGKKVKASDPAFANKGVVITGHSAGGNSGQLMLAGTLLMSDNDARVRGVFFNPAGIGDQNPRAIKYVADAIASYEVNAADIDRVIARVDAANGNENRLLGVAPWQAQVEAAYTFEFPPIPGRIKSLEDKTHINTIALSWLTMRNRGMTDAQIRSTFTTASRDILSKSSTGTPAIIDLANHSTNYVSGTDPLNNFQRPTGVVNPLAQQPVGRVVEYNNVKIPMTIPEYNLSLSSGLGDLLPTLRVAVGHNKGPLVEEAFLGIMNSNLQLGSYSAKGQLRVNPSDLVRSGLVTFEDPDSTTNSGNAGKMARHSHLGSILIRQNFLNALTSEAGGGFKVPTITGGSGFRTIAPSDALGYSLTGVAMGLDVTEQLLADSGVEYLTQHYTTADLPESQRQDANKMGIYDLIRNWLTGSGSLFDHNDTVSIQARIFDADILSDAATLAADINALLATAPNLTIAQAQKQVLQIYVKSERFVTQLSKFTNYADMASFDPSQFTGKTAYDKTSRVDSWSLDKTVLTYGNRGPDWLQDSGQFMGSVEEAGQKINQASLGIGKSRLTDDDVRKFWAQFVTANGTQAGREPSVLDGLSDNAWLKGQAKLVELLNGGNGSASWYKAAREALDFAREQPDAGGGSPPSMPPRPPLGGGMIQGPDGTPVPQPWIPMEPKPTNPPYWYSYGTGRPGEWVAIVLLPGTSSGIWHYIEAPLPTSPRDPLITAYGASIGGRYMQTVDPQTGAFGAVIYTMGWQDRNNYPHLALSSPGTMVHWRGVTENPVPGYVYEPVIMANKW